MIPTLINNRWWLALPEHRAARPEWPTWEIERLAAMHDRIRPGDLVFDVGAEEGDFPALWASWGAAVALVEPNPRVWPNIKAIFVANRLEQQIVGWFVGFAGDEAVQRLEWEAQHVRNDTGWPVCADGDIIGDHGFLVLPEHPQVSVTTIDRMAVQCGAPDVITIDVEGAELTVLRGAEMVLEIKRPVVFVSIHIDMPWIDEKYPGDTRRAVLEYMERYRYRGTHLATDHEEHWMFEAAP